MSLDRHKWSPESPWLSGRPLAQTIHAHNRTLINMLLEHGGRRPVLTIVRAGHDPASDVYVGAKIAAGKNDGLDVHVIHLGDQAQEADVLTAIDTAQNTQNCDGLILQLPLPAHISSEAVTRLQLRIDPARDVDGLHPTNLGWLAKGYAPRHNELLPTSRPLHPTAPNAPLTHVSCTPAGCRALLETLAPDWTIAGKTALVIGRSTIVGRPMALLLTHMDATVILAHRKTNNLSELCRQADVVICAVGVAGLVKEAWVRPGAVLIDVGVNRVPDPTSRKGYLLVGDIDASAINVAAAQTPVPGGVGPLTVAMLMRNTVRAALYRWAYQLPFSSLSPSLQQS